MTTARTDRRIESVCCPLGGYRGCQQDDQGTRLPKRLGAERPDATALDVPTAVSVEAWVKVATVNGMGTIFERHTERGVAYALSQEAGAWAFRVYNVEGGSATATVPLATANVETWVHLVGTFDGTTVRLFRNGVLENTQVGSVTIPTGGGSARIGESSDAVSRFTGGLDEIAVYATTLSSEAVANHYGLRSAVDSVALPLVATDADGDALTYTATGLPTGLILNSATGIITGDPLVTGNYAVTVTAADATGLTASAVFTWTIAPQCAYTVSPGSVASAAEETTGTIVVTTNTGCGWTASSGASWVTLDAQSGTGSGTIGYTIASNAGASRETTLAVAGMTITVTQEAASAPPPVLDAVVPSSGAAGTEVTLSGSGFGAVQGTGSVWLGTRTATVVSWSDTAIVVTVPMGSTTGITSAS